MTARGIVPSYTDKTDTEKHQLQAFAFHDRSRVVMQRYNTGVEGSKLSWWQALYDGFITEDDDADFIAEKYMGLSATVLR